MGKFTFSGWANFPDRNPYLFFGLIGATAGFTLGWVLGLRQGMDPLLLFVLSLAMPAAGWLFGVWTKAVKGRESYVFFHYLLLFLLVFATIPGFWNQPVLEYLDLFSIGFSLFHGVGRLGCWRAGCCHGRPAGKGCVYHPRGPGKSDNSWLVGVRLIPAQLIESFGLFLICFVTSYFFLYSFEPGTALVFYLGAYSFLRFFLEYFRGDPGRKEWKSLSEAQWTGFLMVITLSILAWTGIVPGKTMVSFEAGILFLAFILTGIHSNWGGNSFWRLRRPSHVKELLSLAKPFSGTPQSVPQMKTSSEGLQVSSGSYQMEDGEQLVFAFSRSKEISPQEIRFLARLVQVAFGEGKAYQLENRKQGLWMVIL